MDQKLNIVWPAGPYFAAGRRLDGVMIIALQATIVLWPLALQKAKRLHESRGVQQQLDQFSRTYGKVSVDVPKRFRGRDNAPVTKRA